MNLRVLITKGNLENTYLAIGLEYYIVGQGNSEEDACQKFGATFAAEVAYGISHGNVKNPLEGIPKAPSKYWKIFNKVEESKPLASPPVTFRPEGSQCQLPVSFMLEHMEQQRAVA